MGANKKPSVLYELYEVLVANNGMFSFLFCFPSNSSCKTPSKKDKAVGNGWFITPLPPIRPPHNWGLIGVSRVIAWRQWGARDGVLDIETASLQVYGQVLLFEISARYYGLLNIYV